MKILITGTAGFIGFHAAQHFLNQSWDVVGIDNFSPYYNVQLKRDRDDILRKLFNRRRWSDLRQSGCDDLFERCNL